MKSLLLYRVLITFVPWISGLLAMTLFARRREKRKKCEILLQGGRIMEDMIKELVSLLLKKRDKRLVDKLIKRLPGNNSLKQYLVTKLTEGGMKVYG